MIPRAIWRALHIKETIGKIHSLAVAKTLHEIAADPVAAAALERFFEIVSEASRHIPDDWREKFGAGINWPSIAALGNRIRHAYDEVDLETLWKIRNDDLPQLEAAVDRMIAAYPLPPPPVFD